MKDIAFSVVDCKAIYARAVQRGAKGVKAPWEEKDEHGMVTLAIVQTYGDTTHTFVERTAYPLSADHFLPGYTKSTVKDPLNNILPPVGLMYLDHCVGNQPDDDMTPVADWYTKVMGFHRFWSVDDTQMHTEYSALRWVGWGGRCRWVLTLLTASPTTQQLHCND